LIFCLASGQIDQHWGDFAHHLERVAHKFPFDIDITALKADLKDARKQLWGCDDGERVTVICITEVQLPVCWLRVCAGTETAPRQIEAGLSEIESWARSIGCDRIRLAGRLGWKRRFRAYRQIAVTLEKLL
jgi:hypothetical protein